MKYGWAAKTGATVGILTATAGGIAEPVEYATHEVKQSISDISEKSGELVERHDQITDSVEPEAQDPATTGLPVDEDPAQNPYAGKIHIDVPSQRSPGSAEPEPGSEPEPEPEPDDPEPSM